MVMIDATGVAASLGLLIVVHVLYGLPRWFGTRRVVSLHNGDDFTLADGAPTPERLVGVRAVGDQGTVTLSVTGDRTSGVVVDVSDVATPAWLVAESVPAFIELPADRFTHYLEHEGLDAAITQRGNAATAGPGREVYSKHVKVALRGAHETVWPPPGPVGLPVELQPESAISLGTALIVRALVDGQPARGLQVRVHHKTDDAASPRHVQCSRTDGDGRVVVALDGPGHWRLHAIEMRQHDDIAVADWRSRWACLVLDV